MASASETPIHPSPILCPPLPPSPGPGPPLHLTLMLWEHKSALDPRLLLSRKVCLGTQEVRGRRHTRVGLGTTQMSISLRIGGESHIYP